MQTSEKYVKNVDVNLFRRIIPIQIRSIMAVTNGVGCGCNEVYQNHTQHKPILTQTT